MKLSKRNTITGTLAAALLALGYYSCSAQNERAVNQQAITHNNNGFAVVELFTSEGCSSCPPADKLMEKLQQENTDKPVYIVAFHVDYWDRQGWKDTFSNAAFTNRQRRYADWLHLETIYTPQVVINGTGEYVGSQEGSIVQAISGELNRGTDDSLALQGRVEGSSLHVTYQLTGHKGNAVLFLTLVQKRAETQVRAGENEGRRLSHVQIVRQLVQANINKNSTVISLPAGYNKEDWELIGWVQRTTDGRITTAARLN